MARLGSGLAIGRHRTVSVDVRGPITLMPPPHPTLRAFAQGHADERRVDAVVAESAVEHRISGLVLAAITAGELHADVVTSRRLAIHQVALKQRHDQLAAGCRLVDDKLGRLGFAWMLFKGLSAEARWYESAGDRPATDLDILIEPAAVDRILDVIDALDDRFALASTAAGAVRDHHLQHLELTVGTTPVDLHTDYLKVGVPTRQHNHLWATAHMLEIGGRQLHVPSPEWALIGQVLHLNKDGFSYLGPVMEIDRIASTGGLDWELVSALVAGEGLETPFWCSLERVSELLGKHIGPTAPTRARDRLWQSTWPVETSLQGNEGRTAATARQMWLAATVSGRGGDASREIKRQFLPSRDLFAVAAGATLDRGPYFRRLTIDRARRLVERRHRADR